MKIKFAITEVLGKENEMHQNETHEYLHSFMLIDKAFNKYEEAEDEIKSLKPGIYQIQKIFVIE